MRLLVVTNCQAQVALEVVWQQEQARGRAPGGRRRGSDGLTSIGAWTSGTRGWGDSPYPYSFLTAETVVFSPMYQASHTHTPTQSPDTPLGSP